MPFFDKAVETWKINQNNLKLKYIIYYSSNFLTKKLIYLRILINIKCRISQGFWLDMIFLQRVVCFLSPNLGEILLITYLKYILCVISSGNDGKYVIILYFRHAAKIKKKMKKGHQCSRIS